LARAREAAEGGWLLSTTPFAYVGPPFDERPVSPDGRLGAFEGEEARGRWALEITDDAPGKVGRRLLLEARDQPHGP